MALKSIYQENYDGFTDKVQVGSGIEETPEPELPIDPYDVTFSNNYGDDYEYIRRYSTLESPVDVQNGVIDKFLVLSMLNVDGNASILGITTIESSGFLDVNSNADFAGITTVAATGFLDVNSNADFAGITTVAATGFLDVNSNADFAGITTVSNTTNSTSSSTGALQIKGGVGILQDLNVGGGVQVTGVSTFNGDIILGNAATDNVTFNADVNSNIIPNTNVTYDLGSSSQRWSTGYFSGLDMSGNLTVGGTLTVTGTATFNGSVNLGNSTADNIAVTGDFISNLDPNSNNAYNIGNTTNRWATVYCVGVNVSGAITPSVGNNASNGIYFPTNPGNPPGSGDEAFIRYYVESGENTRLHIGIRNDSDDDLYLEASTTFCTGSFNAGTKLFRISHPLESLKNTHDLVHISIEGPRADLIYRGKCTLVNGIASIDLDEYIGITSGTWNALCRDPQVFVQNNSGWDLVRGSVTSSILTVESQNQNSSDEIDWMVVAERKDPYMYETKVTDENAKPILEPLKT